MKNILSSLWNNWLEMYEESSVVHATQMQLYMSHIQYTGYIIQVIRELAMVLIKIQADD
jgi:hypothetical protein